MDAQSASSSKLTVVIADDALLMRNKLRIVCRGISALDIVGEVEDGQEAYDLCMKIEPDLLLTDNQMISLTGIECARKLKEAGCKTHVVLCTSMGQAGIVTEFDRMIKPFHTEQLRAVLYRTFGDRVSE